MIVALPDEAMAQAGLDQRQTLIEFACWLFDAERLDLWPAARITGLSRVDFEAELLKRGIAIYRYSEADFAQDMATAEKLGF